MQQLLQPGRVPLRSELIRPIAYGKDYIVAEIQTFIYVLRLTRTEMITEGPTPEELKTTHDHFNYLRDLRNQGTVLHAGRTTPVGDRTFGIVILKAESEAEANQIANEDPAVKNKVMTAELYPYRVALVGEGWKEA